MAADVKQTPAEILSNAAGKLRDLSRELENADHHLDGIHREPDLSGSVTQLTWNAKRNLQIAAACADGVKDAVRQLQVLVDVAQIGLVGQDVPDGGHDQA